MGDWIPPKNHTLVKQMYFLYYVKTLLPVILLLRIQRVYTCSKAQCKLAHYKLALSSLALCKLSILKFSPKYYK